ncbi:MAG TPA: isoaspartyl peptidase/L-asparaginase [Phaeodactylibacter sp.]|nr:isoaspartyl peptidase/L-asparaginase [Phaeodactylibacter sp.]
MKKSNLLFALLCIFLFQQCVSKTEPDVSSKGNTKEVTTEKKTPPKRLEYALAIHGGAGAISKKKMTPEKKKEYLAKLNEALSVGEKILKEGGTAMDAVTHTIMVMENSPLFNAGKGAVFTHEGKNELDAAFMEGKTMNAGAIGGVRTIKNPILAARAVMEKSNHVLLTSRGAELFAKEQGLEIVDPKYFYTERRWKSLQRAKKKEAKKRKQLEKVGGILNQIPERDEDRFGTVGCVALDRDGNLVAGTSTGGMTNKHYNRFGDVPLIGAGTYANNNTCAVSCTGHGEYFIRWAVAHDISAMMEYKGVDVKTASEAVIKDKLVKVGGSGGAICVDKYGNISLVFNSKGMYRGYVKPDGERGVAIWED